uniref:Serine-threonine/tyrosine-protein kinase catalytic domain-containing protein n=1 Tax=Oryza brachyantha TaxID=4533 RepID=J3MS02_ORYBR
MLVELLTRKKPSVYISPEGIGLVAHFTMLLNQDEVCDILDGQVIEEGEDEVQQIVAIAAICLRVKGDDRPTMRNVEMKLQGLQGNSNNNIGMQEQIHELYGLTFQYGNGDANDNCRSRQHSMGEEMVLSASLQR